MSDFWAELRAAIERLNQHDNRIADLERRVRELEQQLATARGY